MVLLTITPNDPHEECVFLVLAIFGCVTSEVLVLGAEVLPPGKQQESHYTFCYPSHHLPPAPCARDLQGRKEVTILAEIIDPAHQVDVGLLLHSVAR